MDQQRLTTWKHSLRAMPSRRDVLRGLAGAGLELGALRLPEVVEAKNKGKKKGKKGKNKRQHQTPPVAAPQSEIPPLVFNQYGCLDVGQPCRGDSSLCCSGICQGAAPAAGQPDTSRCIAHGTGTCKQEGEGICTTSNPPALRCNNSNTCLCYQTTAGSNFCADVGSEIEVCAACSKDADCEALGYPPGSACAPLSVGHCAGLCATGMACLPPCGTKPPGP